MYLWEFTPISRSAQFEIVEQFPVSHPWTGNFGFASVKYSVTGSCCFASKLLLSHARHQMIWILTREWRLLQLLLLVTAYKKIMKFKKTKLPMFLQEEKNWHAPIWKIIIIGWNSMLRALEISKKYTIFWLYFSRPYNSLGTTFHFDTTTQIYCPLKLFNKSCQKAFFRRVKY